MIIAAQLALVLASWPFQVDLGEETIVARADSPNGVIEISAGRLRAYAESQPTRSPKALALELVVFELLVQEATQRGLASAPSVQQSIDRAAVPLYLRRDFEPATTTETIPDALLKRSYDRNVSFFRHPELRSAEHLLVTDKAKRPADPKIDAEARALSLRLLEDLHGQPPTNASEFEARQGAFADDAAALGLELRHETLPVFSKRGRLDPSFSDAVFLLPAVGGLSPVIETSFGFHVVRLASIDPARDLSFDDAKPELRDRLEAEYREVRLNAAVDALAKRYGVVKNIALMGGPSAAP